MAHANTSNFLVSESHLALSDVRNQKAEKLKNVGEPLQLPGKAVAVEVLGNHVWVADNTTVARKIELESGKTLQVYSGHRGPVSAIAFWTKTFGETTRTILVTGSWDKTKQLISSTDSHSDFVKSLFVYPSLNLLVSGSSDKIVRFWDLTDTLDGQPLKSAGSISSHTRPVECLGGRVGEDGSVELCTGDTMGIINLWTLTKEDTSPPRWKSSLKQQFKHHRTKITELKYVSGQLWTASLDETVQVVDLSSAESGNPSTPASIQHPTGVRCILPIGLTDLAEPYLITGSSDILRVYDVTSLKEPELINEIDAHWHDVTAIRLWIRKTMADDGITRVEPWVISTSLDGTIRKWKLSDLLTPKLKVAANPKQPSDPKDGQEGSNALTAEEEAELAELMDD
ncbi:hypothetical protein D9758_001692 [Tetrapyrgos nigripes]|uniref:WD40 repeat-like protein n=1 Tax=Tetrapyrgos nigripes TaxID=182062 RepID=A0A8H5LXH5_9AGAR|nr:hypothetical protein D9758_001692 [Tetrapyrgos nigripes]